MNHFERIIRAADRTFNFQDLDGLVYVRAAAAFGRCKLAMLSDVSEERDLEEHGDAHLGTPPKPPFRNAQTGRRERQETVEINLRALDEAGRHIDCDCVHCLPHTY